MTAREGEEEGEEVTAIRSFVAISLFMQYIKLKIVNSEKQSSQRQLKRRGNKGEKTKVSSELNSNFTHQNQVSVNTSSDINLESEFVNELACKKQAKWIMSCIQFYQQQHDDDDNDDDDNDDKLTAKMLVKLFKQQLMEDEREEGKTNQSVKMEEEEEGNIEGAIRGESLMEIWNVRENLYFYLTHLLSFSGDYKISPLSTTRVVFRIITCRALNRHF